jgi:hypothetical protein
VQVLVVSVPAPRPPPHASLSPVLFLRARMVPPRQQWRSGRFTDATSAQGIPTLTGGLVWRSTALQVTTDSYLFAPLFREAFGLPRNFWPYNFEQPVSWEPVGGGDNAGSLCPQGT